MLSNGVTSSIGEKWGTGHGFGRNTFFSSMATGQPGSPVLRLALDRVEERLDVGIPYEVHLRAFDPVCEGIQRIMRAASRPEPVTEPEEVFLLDHVQHLGHRPLEDLVFQRCNAERAQSAIRLGYELPP